MIALGHRIGQSESMSEKNQSAGANIFSLFKQKGSRFYSMRLMHRGKRRRFSTGKSSLKDAKLVAKHIMADIESRGFEDAVRIHSRRRDEVPLDPTIEEFVDLYRKLSASFDNTPSRTTRERYIRSLVRIATRTKVSRISKLDAAKVEQFKRLYMEDAREQNRAEGSLRTTLNGILRNSAALFSSHALQAYKREGLNLENPFAGAQMRGIRLKPYSPLPRDLVKSIWKGAAKLRDGDKKADAPDPKLPTREQFDFREPHPDSYVILLLEIGLGLRRDEADKAEWQWFFTDSEGRQYVEVRETPFFIPKSKQSRVIPVEEALWKSLRAAKSNDHFVVEGVDPKPIDRESELKSKVYRCDRAHRSLVAWLRMMGVDDPKPCHRLRKEFGSYISTTFGLFQAQQFLGHSSPSVTSDYYAGLTELPSIKPSQMGKQNGKKKQSRKR